MATLHSVLRDIYETHERYCSAPPIDVPLESVVRLEVSIDTEVFEIPSFLVNSWGDRAVNLRGDQLPSVITVKYPKIITNLYHARSSPGYASLEVNVKTIFSRDFRRYRLSDFTAKGVETPFYATNGAIFDSSFNPLMMCTYQVTTKEKDGLTCIVGMKPVLRISPACYSDNNPVTRLITGKILKEVLSLRPWNYINNSTALSVKVIFHSNLSMLMLLILTPPMKLSCKLLVIT